METDLQVLMGQVDGSSELHVSKTEIHGRRWRRREGGVEEEQEAELDGKG